MRASNPSDDRRGSEERRDTGDGSGPGPAQDAVPGAQARDGSVRDGAGPPCPASARAADAPKTDPRATRPADQSPADQSPLDQSPLDQSPLDQIHGAIPLTVEEARDTFVESCLNTVAGSAVAAHRTSRDRPRAARLLRLLAGKKNILVTTHEHPDPDALASAHALRYLLTRKLKDVSVTLGIKGQIAGGLNDAFTRHAHLDPAPLDDAALKAGQFDAIVLLDCQPNFAYSPLPAGVLPLAVIDHHRTRGGRIKCPFCDVRPDVGATASIVFSYFLELQVPIPPDLAAALLYAVETDLAGAAGQPGELDNVALSNLTLLADNHTLYQMRYVDLPQSYFVMSAVGLANAVYYDNAITSFLGPVDTLEKPALMADFLLRFAPVNWSLVTAVHEKRLMLSLRTSSKQSAAELMRRLVRKLGEGGGHRTKAGGMIELVNGSDAEVERLRAALRRRFLRALGINVAHGQRLVPPSAMG